VPTAMRYSRTHPAPWAPTLEEIIIGKVHELDRGLNLRKNYSKKEDQCPRSSAGTF
jgi:hypothetical protein